ncbi:uncharacterized protein LOC118201663 isoform X2 [Stegodyphus dumicola]|uniref:uncharacterized protein LOC118201663 isoform X2 n=1 Tax=Stegodyphus dumicola TaxID=202533 RepID=UPI0015A8A4EA|nr:uncharacterized protein LOC118201663 isoform X2 [Stegodyphus dumicola]
MLYKSSVHLNQRISVIFASKLYISFFTQNATHFYLHVFLISAAKDAYLCVASAPKKCKKSYDKEDVRLSPVFKGSLYLLRDFCGFRSRRRPCCALRTSYLEHKSCYKRVRKQLNECNDKYRTSLELIMGMQHLQEQKEERYCSMRWFSKCVKKATMQLCGRPAAKIMKAYATKVGMHHRSLYQKNKGCSTQLFGYQKISESLCQQNNFDRCYAHLHFSHEPALSDDQMTEGEEFLAVCRRIHDSFECLTRTFKRCLYNTQRQRFEKMIDDDMLERNYACPVDTKVADDYQSRSHCLSEIKPQMLQCKQVLENPTLYTNHTLPFEFYNRFFCQFIYSLADCVEGTASKSCGRKAKSVVHKVIQMAASNLLLKCMS